MVGNESMEIRTMRMMEWERAKGSLGAILASYWDDDNYPKMKKAVTKFIETVEDEGLHE
jgi:hypothetical protein